MKKFIDFNDRAAKLPMSRLEIILKAIKYQCEDPGIWCVPTYIETAYVQQALRDLHRVIEDGDLDALDSIKDCAECASGKTLE